MNIKNVLKAYSLSEENLNKNLICLKSFFADEEKLWFEFQKLDNTFLLDNRVIALLADSLQMADQNDHLKLATLQDIKCIYQLLAESYPDNIQYQENLIAFVYNVLDDEIEALLLIDKVEQRIESTRKYFSEIKKEINNK